MTYHFAAAPDVAALVLEGSGVAVADQGADSIRFEWEAPPTSDAALVWAARAPAAQPPVRLIAPAGERLWRRAPWPAADALFDLEPQHKRVLVVEDGIGPEVAQGLREQSVDVSTTGRLDRTQLDDAGVVVIVDEPGASLPGEATAVLAAGRVLVTTPRSPDFGLKPGIDHLRGAGAQEVVDLTTSVFRHWDAFASVRVYGRIAAERHRASRVLADLCVDLELDL